MNNRYKKAFQYFFIFILLITGLTSCKHKQQPPHQVSEIHDNSYYTCSMHPQVHEDHPGNCPICQMKLIKVEVTRINTGMERSSLYLTATQIELGNIQTDTVREENTGDEKTITGTVTTDENKAEQLSARTAGRIQKLFIRATGEKISIGQPIYALYSEDLLASEKEYLLAKEQQKVLNNPDMDYKQLIGAAENKLLLWGLSASQIRKLASTGKTMATTTILSKINGTVSDILVHEGDYVTEGMPILKTQALNSLWVEAQLYASETGSYHKNDAVNVAFPDLGGQVIKGKIDFINPELSDATKVDLIRVIIDNRQGLIRPGMLAYISITKLRSRTLAIPASSLLTSGKGDLVWVKNADGGFSPKMVKVGAGNQNYVTILSGLKLGDIIVTNGGYLLNSEATFKNGDNAMGVQ